MKELILGGARSGKSSLAERHARESGLEVVYIATAHALDDPELQQRIDQHRRRRPAEWLTVEEPYQLAAALQINAAVGRCLLVDCLTLWLTNLLCADAAPPASDASRATATAASQRATAGISRLAAERAALLDTLPRLPGHLILVGSETGLGVVPLGELTRRFVDEAGDLHQELARRCDRVIFTVAGLPQILKGTQP
ncbi:MAG TPA: bifunctional adenosylcobinamide kinase/adenosylcobinamide-phosphate guanylyltransferase [Steroidobacteraceae bacterium]|nr:bifunctional adenosylcobinamide kinase/adenosylcobinamide-phosphate guanylyltransferase [Steroidobacteraceae bacterium]